jgi:hypothetical protein
MAYQLLSFSMRTSLAQEERDLRAAFTADRLRPRKGEEWGTKESTPRLVALLLKTKG